MEEEKRMILELEKLAIGYGKRKKPLIEDIDLKVREGEIISLLGQNGVGKSTFIYTLSGITRALKGSIVLYGKDMLKLSPKELSKNMAALLTRRPETEWMTVREMVEMGRYPYTGRLGRLGDRDKEIVSDLINELELNELEDKLFYRLSDGQKQRVMLAKALCQEPKLLLLDEPAGFLDIKYKIEMTRLLKRLAREKNIAIIAAIHELDIAKEISDHVLCFKDKKTVFFEKGEDAFQKENIDWLFDI
ncbi:MAG: ABC transporter ATP-binding protein [Lachnospiraceae bacterium]|nr:ABC transporter ATP-binding protein [Lachnospiraceae bacterium]